MLRTVSQKTGFYEYSAGSIKLSEPSMGEFVYGTCNSWPQKTPPPPWRPPSPHKKRRAYLRLNSHTHANIFIQLY